MSEYLFDLIDWGVDKELEKCYRFNMYDDFHPEFFEKCFDSELNTKVESLGYVEDLSAIGKIGVPYSKFWFEYGQKSKYSNPRRIEDRRAAYCEYYQVDRGEDREMAMCCHFFRYITEYKRGGSPRSYLGRSNHLAIINFDKKHDVDYIFFDTGFSVNHVRLPDVLRRSSENLMHEGYEDDDGLSAETTEETAPYLIEFLKLRTERDMIHHTPNRQQVRKAQRKGNLPPHEYYELTINPRGTSRNTSGGNKSQGLNRHHSVMGNWAYYSPETPLLGHTSGWVWRPAHMRGNQKRGTIDKDYKVSTKAS